MQVTWLRKKGLKSRIIYAFIVIPFVLMMTLFLFYYSMSANIVLDKSYQASNKLLRLTEENIYLNTVKIKEQFTRLQKEFAFAQMIQKNNEWDEGNVASQLKERAYLEHFVDIQLFDLQKQKVFQVHGQKYCLESILEHNVFYEDYTWEYLEQEQQILMIKKIRDHGSVVGYALCSFPKQMWNTRLNEVDCKEDVLVLIDYEDHCLFGSKYIPYGTNVKGNKEVHLFGETYFKNTKAIRGTSWQVAHVVEKEYLFSELYGYRNMVLLYALIMVVVLELIAIVIYHSIFDPMNHILKTMREIDEKSLLDHRVVDEGNDEVHQLASTFNDLLDRIELLVEAVEHEQEQKRETQFQLLQAQINPHFLFNTLNTLYFLAIMNDDKPVSEGIHALAKLLRNTITDKKEMVSVAQELENIKNYIVIQKLRYGDLFETIYNIDEEVMDCTILKFILQPIVENSILHAFEEDQEHQILTIRIQKYLDYLKIEIGDNGKGYNVKEQKSKNTLSGIGIHNIAQRISLMYGEQYGMNIKSEVGMGTIVTLLLPFRKENEDVQGNDCR